MSKARDQQALDLVIAFHQIQDEMVRKTIIDMVQAVARGAAFELKRVQPVKKSENSIN